MSEENKDIEDPNEIEDPTEDDEQAEDEQPEDEQVEEKTKKKKVKKELDPEDDPTRITPREYIKTRVQGQIDYFNAKSGQAQKDYKKFKRLEFLLSALIPVIVTFSSMGVAKDTVFFTVGGEHGSKVNLDLMFQVAAALMGIWMAVLNKVVDLEEYYKRWKDFRVNSEALEHEKHLFMTRSAEYEDEEEGFSKFVDKVESILANDVQRWKQKNKQQEEQQQQGIPKVKNPRAQKK